MTSTLVPEPIPLPQVKELLAYDASKSWSNDSTDHWLLGHSTGEEIDVVNVLVNILNSRYCSRVHHCLQLFPLSEPLQPTLLSPNVVRRQPVVSASLQVQSSQVHPKG